MNPLDLTTALLGLAYIWLEYRASIWMWLVGFVMQALGIVLYYQKGLYADCGMEFYYLAMTVYGYLAWRGISRRRHRSSADTPSPTPITHFPRCLILPWVLLILTLWAGIYTLLVCLTDSTVPLADSFTTALSIVGIWALARKYLEQWWIWLAVDAVTCGLYFYKGIPFKASLYGLYVVIAIAGYHKWRKQCVGREE